MATGDKTVGFAKGTGIFPFLDKSRAHHASRHLTEAGILPNWNNATYEKFKEIGQQIVENPVKSFDDTLRGGESVKVFYGKVEGKDVVFQVFKTGPDQGKIATSFVPSLEQLKKWGIQ